MEDEDGTECIYALLGNETLDFCAGKQWMFSKAVFPTDRGVIDTPSLTGGADDGLQSQLLAVSRQAQGNRRPPDLAKDGTSTDREDGGPTRLTGGSTAAPPGEGSRPTRGSG